MNAALWGVVTWYVASIGAPLYCGGTYQTGEAWLALPVEAYESGEARCGDLFAVWTDGELVYLPARDAGPFGRYCVEAGGQCLDILADLPRHAFPGRRLSRRAYVVNSQPLRERLEMER